MVGSVGNGGADHSLDKGCSMDHWSGDNSLHQRSGVDDGHRVNDRSADHSLEQRSRVHKGHRVHHGSSSIGAHNWGSMDHRSSGIGLHHRHLAYQIHIALVGDGRRGRGVHIGGLGQHSGLHQGGVCLGKQTRSSGSDGQASEEGNLKKEQEVKLVSRHTYRLATVAPSALTNLNIFEYGLFNRCESIATVDAVDRQRALLYIPKAKLDSFFLVTSNSGYHCRVVV